MKKFITENPTLAFGLALPLLIVAVFLLASAIPDIGAVPPKYPVVFATNYTPNGKGINIQIQHGKAKVVFVGENNYYTVPKLFVYTPATGNLREIPINLPPELVAQNHQPCCPTPKESDKITPVSVPALEALTLDDSGIAPDGYEFAAYDSYSHDPMGGLFFSGSRYRNHAVLKKGGHRVHLPERDDYYGYNTRFIGWVVEK